MAAFSPEQAKALLQKNALNLATKIKNGETLAAKEMAILEDIAEGGAGSERRFAKDQTELAEILGINRRTIQRWLKKPGHPVTEANGKLSVIAWREFAKAQGTTSIGDEDDADAVKERARNLLLQNEKLAFQIKVLKKEYVATGDIEQWGAHLGGEIRKTVVSIHKVASSLAGLTPAEIEIRVKELEDEILSKLHLLSQRTDELKEASNVQD
ncbi:MAG: hypothetical protein WCH99_08800 [Verrucomicrobiota bacterium]